MTSLAGNLGRVVPIESDDPRAEIRIGAGLAGLFFLGLLGSAAFLPLDQANTASGDFIVAGHRQVIQSREGGVVSLLKAVDGDQVRAGELLVSFADADALAVEHSLVSRLIAKEAEIARLRAEQTGADLASLPIDIRLNPEDQGQVAQALLIAQTELKAQRSANAAQRAVFHRREQEARDQIVGYQRQISSNQRQQQLNAEELAGMKSLQAQGYAPATRVRELERSAAGLVGDAGAQAAEIARLKATEGEAGLQIVQGDAERSKDVADELDKAEAELQELRPQLNAARETLARTEIRAPVAGAVVASNVNMVGAVVAPGQKVMEIVPRQSGYVVEARVSPQSLEGFRVGRTAKVQIAGLRDRQASALDATVTRVAADALSDEKTGLPYYTVAASISPAQVGRLPPSDEVALRPGMPVSLTVTVRKRTALQYLVGPLSQSLSGGMHER